MNEGRWKVHRERPQNGLNEGKLIKVKQELP